MNALAKLVCNRVWAWTIVLVVLAVAGGSLHLARNVEHEDDILSFLPRDNPEVQLFQQINSRFGGLDVALVGVQAADPLAPDFLRRLRNATTALKQTPGLDHVMSLANIMDFTPDREKGGIMTAHLIDKIPASAAQQEALRRKVMSRGHVVGNLISADGKSVLIYCYLAYGSDPKVMAGKIRGVVSGAFPKEDKYWGGGPFLSTYIYTTTQNDVRRLTPWAVLAIVVIMILAFRDIIGSCLALLSTAMGIVISLGAMAGLGVRFNIVLGSMPVILFAIGSAYGIHVLARYYTLSQQLDVERSIHRTLTGVGPTVLAAGMTTAASLLSFVWMDIQPLRTFGLFTSLGILATLGLSLTFIPAVIRITGLKRKQTSSIVVRRLMVRVTVFARRRRLPVAVALGVVAAVGLFFTARVDTSMDEGTFFSAGSQPDLAEKFLRRQFGGSQFVQLYIQGDMGDPGVLREVRAMADEIALMPHVSSVLHLGEAVARINEVLVGQRRIPDTKQQVGLLYSFLLGDPAVAQLVSSDRKQALMHIKVASNRSHVLEPLVERLEQWVEKGVLRDYQVAVASGPRGAQVKQRLRKLMVLRVKALASYHRIKLSATQAASMERGLSQPPPPVSAAAVEAEVVRFMLSEECAVELPALTPPPAPGAPAAPQPPAAKGSSAATARLLARALVKLGERPTEQAQMATIARLLGRKVEHDLVQDLGVSVAAPMEEIWRIQRAAHLGAALVKSAGLQVPADGRGARFTTGMAASLMDRDLTRALLPPAKGASAAGTVAVAVNGLPVMHRGLSRSVTMNQIKSLGFALVLVVVIMAALFRSLWSGLLVATPTLLTLLMIYGGMGLLGVHLDIGTSMLACIILGAGVDYAVHLASAWHGRDDEPLSAAAARAADASGPAIWTNAIMVCAGFFVLTLGQARPLQNVGGLTAAAMITAALVTFLALPALARRRRYSRNKDAHETTDASAAVDEVLAREDVETSR